MSGKVTTRQLFEASALWAAGYTITDMAQEVGVGYNTMWSLIDREREMFPPRRHHIDWWSEQLEKVEGIPAPAAAARLGCCKNTILYWRRKLEHDS